MNSPWVYTCSPSWTPPPSPSQYPPSGSSQCTSPKHPVSRSEPGVCETAKETQMCRTPQFKSINSSAHSFLYSPTLTSTDNYCKNHSSDSFQFSSVAQSCPNLRPHESQHARPPCPSPSPGVHSNSCASCFNALLSNHPALAFSHRVQKFVLYICISFAVSHIRSSLPSF